MNRKSTNFNNEKIAKVLSIRTRNYLHDLDVNKILVSKKESYGTKN